MQILAIHLQNIKSHRDTTLTFSAGINVLSGPNGIGKSTIFEAIGYALFGVDAQSFVGNIERFISIGEKRGLIEVDFLLKDEEFRVSRTVAKASKWLLAKKVGGEFEVEEHKDSKETEGRIKQLLGLNNGRALAEQFELVIGPFQHEFLGPFVIKQATKRRDKFDEILGIASWRKTFNDTKALTSAIKAKVDVLQAEIGSKQEQIEVLPIKRLELKSTLQQGTQAQADLAEQQQQLRELETQLLTLEQQQHAVQTLQSAIATHRERIQNGCDKIASQKGLITAAQEAQKVVDDTFAGFNAFEQATVDFAALQGQVKQQRQLEQQVAQLDKQHAATIERHATESKQIECQQQELANEQQQLAEQQEGLVVDEGLRTVASSLAPLRSEIAAVQTQQGQLTGRRAGFKEGSEKLATGVCPFFQEKCLNIADRPADDVFTAKLDDLGQQQLQLEGVMTTLRQQESQAVDADQQLKAMKVRQEALAQQQQGLQQRQYANDQRSAALQILWQQQQVEHKNLQEQQQALAKFSGLQAGLDRLDEQKRLHQPARDRYVANQQQAAELKQRQDQLVTFERFLLKLQHEVQKHETDLQQALRDYCAESHQQQRGKKDRLTQQIGGLSQKVISLNADQQRLSAEVAKLKKIETEVADKKGQVKVYADKDELVKFLRNKVFRNVSGYLSERFRKEISLRADRIYRTIAEVDEELCWGENYQIILRDLDDGELRERIDEQLSGGQIMSAVVSLRLALLQTIGARIAFFDEPTSNLDAARRENLAHAFRAIDVGREEVTEHWYDQLFLISHDVAFTEVTDQIISLGE
ncbi:MAG: SMC family ATPase [Deltaproteobacteria bacterium]|nr:SMC family ATPase [Deltaproteobacteria bacterium]